MKNLLGLYYRTKSEPDAKTPACYVRGQKLLSTILVLEVSCSERAVNH